MNIGYARVSTLDQNPQLQLDALRQAGCEKIFKDRVTGSKFERKGLGEALEYLRPGDKLVVWKLDRAGRSLKHLIELVNGLNTRSIEFTSLTEAIDTSTPSGRLLFHIMGALAEFERDLIRERTHAGLDAARAHGRKGGRPRALSEKKITLLKTLHSDPEQDFEEICTTLHISRRTAYRYLEALRENEKRKTNEASDRDES